MLVGLLLGCVDEAPTSTVLELGDAVRLEPPSCEVHGLGSDATWPGPDLYSFAMPDNDGSTDWAALLRRAPVRTRLDALRFTLVHESDTSFGFASPDDGRYDCDATQPLRVMIWTQEEGAPSNAPASPLELDVPGIAEPSRDNVVVVDLSSHDLVVEAGQRIVVAIEMRRDWTEDEAGTWVGSALCLGVCQDAQSSRASWWTLGAEPAYDWVPLSTFFAGDFGIALDGTELVPPEG